VNPTRYRSVVLLAPILSCLGCADGTGTRSSLRSPTDDVPVISQTQPSEPTAERAELTDKENAGRAGAFQLLWEEPFDFIDIARWAAQTHTWDGNLAQFSLANVRTVEGRLQLALTASESANKPFNGVEYRSRESITYGKVEASMRFAKGSGVVSSLVLLYTPWPPDDWNELDIECLGNTVGDVQFNHMVNIPPADPISAHLQFPSKVDLGFDPTAAFHTYAIEWLPNSARFLVDGVLVHQAIQEVSRLRLPQNILLTIWASDAASWAGPIDGTTAPTAAEVDWLRVYAYVPK
jgi:endo-1,3-1,4-beta-glycanase ExoK